jgi:hypothetical protein
VARQGCVQVLDRLGDLCRGVERLVVAARNQPVVKQAGEPGGMLLACPRPQYRVLGWVEDDRGGAGCREAGQQALVVLVLGGTGDQPVAVTVGMNGNINEVGVASSASVSTRSSTSRPIAACWPGRGVDADANRVGPNPRR